MIGNDTRDYIRKVAEVSGCTEDFVMDNQGQ